MAIVLDHTIVPAHDKEASAKFFARIFGLGYEGTVSHFAPVRVNETLVMDFDTWPSFESHHYAFKVGGTEFNSIFQRVKDEVLRMAVVLSHPMTCRSIIVAVVAGSTSRTRTGTCSKS